MSETGVTCSIFGYDRANPPFFLKDYVPNKLNDNKKRVSNEFFSMLKNVNVDHFSMLSNGMTMGEYSMAVIVTNHNKRNRVH